MGKDAEKSLAPDWSITRLMAACPPHDTRISEYTRDGVQEQLCAAVGFRCPPSHLLRAHPLDG